MSSKENVSSTVEEINENKEPVAVDFTDMDVKVVIQIMDVASARGCFRPAEMKGIGEFYEKLAKLVNVSPP